ncbi:MAG: adenylate/guanylate cyclase domain-containing protein [Deltaproteobacteria bacterium]|nr:adenylate/guanylate cyclase domain-containing protein [Deltaproteobacteria bacterium]MBW2610972.1 adenylate/guanylate cyclase domain-containing protein [Deltaproteobacteria bacterium]MBW2633451.1 adenylate/guanylate cyclase domain-containing protein [Deltaproteobacteria bacterium]
MGTNRKFRVGLTDKMVLIGIGLAAVYWILDTILSVFISYDLNMTTRLFGTENEQIFPRIIVICLFVIFGSHSQFTINERKKAEEKSKKETATRERFQRLLSPDLAEMVVSGALNVEKGGTNRVATVMFVDIRDFTAMSEDIPAAEILQMLNEYYEKIVDIVFTHEGTVDKFIGDAIMVIWGAPVAHDDDPARAVRAAIDIRRELVDFNKQRVSVGKREIKIGVGINTGKVVAGYIGSSQTMSYSVVGDTVNTAARLCSAAKAGEIIISEITHTKIKDLFPTKGLEPIKAKGKHNLLKVYNIPVTTDA